MALKDAKPDIDTRHIALNQTTIGHLAGFAAWLLLLGALVTLAGYIGPWIDHGVAALLVTGLDLGEYVKFLAAVRQNQVTVWREGFYLPLAAVSLTLSLHCYRDDFRYPWPVRASILLLAAVAALNLLPPAWSPMLLLIPEFRLQTMTLGLCILAILLSPFLAQLPRALVLALSGLLTLLALFFPPRDFLRVLPDIAGLYRQTLHPGWGFYVSITGLLLLLGAILASNIPLQRRPGPGHKSGK